jgi:hypothetical protein
MSRKTRRREEDRSELGINEHDSMELIDFSNTNMGRTKDTSIYN